MVAEMCGSLASCGLTGQARGAKKDHSDEKGFKRVNVSTILSPIAAL